MESSQCATHSKIAKVKNYSNQPSFHMDPAGLLQKQYVIKMEYHSKIIFKQKLPNFSSLPVTCLTLVNALKAYFSRHGILEKIKSVPQYSQSITAHRVSIPPSKG